MSEHDAVLDCLIVGRGPVGLAAAVAFAQHGLAVGLAGPPGQLANRPLDARTFALFQPTLRFLERLGVWPMPAGDATPLQAIRLVDDTGRLVRAPDASFAAAEIGLPAFGYNIPHAALVAALSRRQAEIVEESHVFPSFVQRIEGSPTALTAHLADGRAIRTRLLIGADGRQSACRELAGLASRRWAYDQSALVATVLHSRPHDFVSTELHRPGGPLTTVPLPGLSSSIVWVDRPCEIDRLRQLDDATFGVTLHETLQGLLGRITATGARQVYHLEGLLATPAGRCRVALVGEALHAFPPIGAQGLNLGFRDVASLVDAVAPGGTPLADAGDNAVLEAYTADRARDVSFRTMMVHTLDHSLISSLPPLQMLRGAGLHLVNQLPRLKQALMRRGLGPTETLPRMMRAPSPSPSTLP